MKPAWLKQIPDTHNLPQPLGEQDYMLQQIASSKYINT